VAYEASHRFLSFAVQQNFQYMYLLKENKFDAMLFALTLHLKSLPDPHTSCPGNYFFQIKNEPVHVKIHLRLKLTQIPVHEIF
jgi:hypothetical protein